MRHTFSHSPLHDFHFQLAARIGRFDLVRRCCCVLHFSCWFLVFPSLLFVLAFACIISNCFHFAFFVSVLLLSSLLSLRLALLWMLEPGTFQPNAFLSVRIPSGISRRGTIIKQASPELQTILCLASRATAHSGGKRPTLFGDANCHCECVYAIS